MNRYDFEGKTIVVTGGAGGIGAECAKLLATGGAHVHLVDPRADALATAAQAADGKVTTHVSELDSSDACATAFDTAGKPPYGLVHLVGVFEDDPFEPETQNV